MTFTSVRDDTIDGQSFTAADAVVKFTYFGDADLDGDVDGIDVAKWATNFTGSGVGVLDIPGAQPAAVKTLETMGFTVVPEPASLGIFGIAALAVTRRRRR